MDEPGIGAHIGVTVSGMLGLRPLDVPPQRSRLSDVRANNPDYFFSNRYEPVWRPLLRDLILRRIAAQLRDRTGRLSARTSMAVIKEPHGSQAADILMSALPRARLIFLLRDGRDVVDSGLDSARAGSWGSSQLDGFETSDVDRRGFIRDRAHAWLWKTEVVQRAFREHAPSLRVQVRYEDLLNNPVGELTQLVRWLGLELSEDGIAEAVGELAFNQIPAEKRGAGQFVRAATPGLWKKNLSSDEQSLLDSIIGPKLKECGYA